MKISNFAEVNRLVGIRKECECALENAAGYEYDENKEPFHDGFSFTAGLYADRSGFSIDMDGCYVAAEVTRAVINVLHEQIARIDARLTELGVDVE